MNSLSYTCPELLEGEDGLSDAARAKKLSLGEKSESRSVSLGSGAFPKDSINFVYISHQCELSDAEIVAGFEPRVNVKHDQLCQGYLCEKHHRYCKQSWICGKCSARLRERRDCFEWEDGYCGACGVLNCQSSKIGPPVIEDGGRVRETWPPLDSKWARFYGAVVALGNAMSGM